MSTTPTNYKAKHYPACSGYLIAPQYGSLMIGFYYDKRLSQHQAREACKLTATILNGVQTDTPKEKLLPFWQQLLNILPKERYKSVVLLLASLLCRSL